MKDRERKGGRGDVSSSRPTSLLVFSTENSLYPAFLSAGVLTYVFDSSSLALRRSGREAANLLTRELNVRPRPPPPPFGNLGHSFIRVNPRRIDLSFESLPRDILQEKIELNPSSNGEEEERKEELVELARTSLAALSLPLATHFLSENCKRHLQAGSSLRRGSQISVCSEK